MMDHPHFSLAVRPESADSLQPNDAVAKGELGELLMRAAHLLEQVFAIPGPETELNEARFSVLSALEKRSAAGCSQTELATSLRQSESNLSTLLERMRIDGLIHRERSLSDRRKSRVHMTTQGAVALNRARAHRGASLAPMLQSIPPQLIELVTTGLVDLVRVLEARLAEVSVATDPIKESRRTGKCVPSEMNKSALSDVA